LIFSDCVGRGGKYVKLHCNAAGPRIHRDTGFGIRIDSDIFAVAVWQLNGFVYSLSHVRNFDVFVQLLVKKTASVIAKDRDFSAEIDGRREPLLSYPLWV
jgi:hypothetical protein